MRSKRSIHRTTDKARWEIALFHGLDDWRVGVYVERHPSETQVSLHVPCLSLNILRVR